MVPERSIKRPEEHIQPLNLSTDLNKVADLVETCFPIQNDPDGQTYIREMRQAARDYRRLGWLSQIDQVRKGKAAGFVWVEGETIVGNLSLIPFKSGGNNIYLLANVAVHPEYRRKGIAKTLTVRALKHLRKHGEREVWLQVRHDNQPAVDLYRSVGFLDRVTRTTWRIQPNQLTCLEDSGPQQVSLSSSYTKDWEKQQQYLALTYPKEMRWNLPINFRRFQPGVFQGISNFLDGVTLKRWEIIDQGRVCGWITWQKSDTFANNLWLAFREDLEPSLLPEALNQVFLRLNKRHTVSVDYPFGRFQEGFERLGFNCFRTLIWMRLALN